MGPRDPDRRAACPVHRPHLHRLDHFQGSPVPKLLLHGRPGAVITADTVARCRKALGNLTVVEVGKASHFLPEDQPARIVAAISSWLTQ